MFKSTIIINTFSDISKNELSEINKELKYTFLYLNDNIEKDTLIKLLEEDFKFYDFIIVKLDSYELIQPLEYKFNDVITMIPNYSFSWEFRNDIKLRSHVKFELDKDETLIDYFKGDKFKINKIELEIRNQEHKLYELKNELKKYCKHENTSWHTERSGQFDVEVCTCQKCGATKSNYDGYKWS